MVRNPKLTEYLEYPPEQTSSSLAHLKTRIMPAIYNRVISSSAYWLLELLPFVEIGATHYSPLSELSTMPPLKQALLAINIQRYQIRKPTLQTAIHNIVPRDVLDLPSVCESYCGQRLLRYPVLASSPTDRDTTLAKLDTAGAGGSALYAAVLPDIPGVKDLVRCHSPLNNASDFASRLITLPTHNGVKSKQLDMIHQSLPK